MVTRKKAAATHLLISIIIASVIGVAFSYVYFPGYYFTVYNGWHRFFLIVGIDIVLGPLLTLIIFNPKKPKAELIRDVSLIGIIQISALVYGLYVFAQTRPVYTVFTGRALFVVSANEFLPDALKNLKPPFDKLPKFGPQEAFAKQPVGKEMEEKVMISMGEAYWPELYEPMTDQHKKELFEASDPLDTLKPALTEQEKAWIERKKPASVQNINQLKAIPAKCIGSENSVFWAIITPDGDILTMYPIHEELN